MKDDGDAKTSPPDDRRLQVDLLTVKEINLQDAGAVCTLPNDNSSNCNRMVGYFHRNKERGCNTFRQPHRFHQEVERLTWLLEMERDKNMKEKRKVSELASELDYTKSQLERQKTLKEMYINREKDAKRQMERVLRFSDPETLRNVNLASQVQSTITQRKKVLQEDYEELQVAYVVQRETLAADLQNERQKNKSLQEEIHGLRASKRELKSRFQAEILAARQENLTLQEELDRRSKSHADRRSKDLEMIGFQRDEKRGLHQRLAEEKPAEKDNTGLQSQVARLPLNCEMTLNRELSTEIPARMEYRSPRRKIKRRRQTEEPVQSQTPQRQEQAEEESSLTVLQRREQQERDAVDALLNDPEALDDDEPPEKKDKRSLWKKTRNFTSLKKPDARRHK